MFKNMNTRKIAAAAIAALMTFGAFAQESKPTVKFYGFIRNYFTLDTHESVAGTEDFFDYLPKDQNLVSGNDLNDVTTFRFAALTSRLGLDVTGYQIQGWNIAARIEGDFYAGVSGNTGTAQYRLRQAYVTLGKNAWNLKIGQAWHPMAADMPDVISLNTGAPFGPFSRTPEVVADYKMGEKFSLTGAALWQMQYTSTGPEGASANYMKYGCTPEFYLGLNYKSGAVTARIGADLLSIKPRHYNTLKTATVNDRITTVSPYAYFQYSGKMLTVKAKTIYAQGGEHMNLNGGYGVHAINADDSWTYTPTRNSSSWLSISYGKKVQGVFFAGYVRNFGSAQTILSPSYLYFSKNSFSNLNRLWRIEPTIIYNMGKVAFALEYELTNAQYGSVEATKDYYGLATKDLHWVHNNRVEFMVKYTF